MLLAKNAKGKANFIALCHVIYVTHGDCLVDNHAVSPTRRVPRS